MKTIFRIALIMSVLALFVVTVAASPISQERTDGQAALGDGRAEDAQRGAVEQAQETGGTADVLNPDGSDTDVMGRAQVISQDLVVQGSNCVGLDCVSSESFGFETIRLKENNLRIRFMDTSNSASFPTNDWQITANDSSNGGKNKFSIDDLDGGRTPFTIEASAPTNSLYVDDGGRIGQGTDAPVVQFHQVDGNTPTFRLQQDGSSGFSSQTWDVAGNEANFFIRDATNGSQLPFKIQPGADHNTLYLASDNDIGMGTSNPGSGTNATLIATSDVGLHINKTNGHANIIIDENSSTTANRTMLVMENNGAPSMEFINTNSNVNWFFQMNSDDDFVISEGTVAEMKIRQDGTFIVGPNNAENIRVNGGNAATILAGNLTVNGAAGCTGCKTGTSKDVSGVLETLEGISFRSWDTTYSAPGETKGSDFVYDRQHISPDAAQFNAAFGLGQDNPSQIAPLDVASVALAAAQQLHAELQAKDAIIAEQQERINDLESRVDQLEELVNDLLAQQ